jgi:hypothetical protein
LRFAASKTNQALYERYSPGVEQEQVKAINQLVDNHSSALTIHFKEALVLQEDEEYLKTFYPEK